MNIGERIKHRRTELDMSVDELAKQLGKNRATVYRYEKGDIENLPLDILEPISKALKTTPPDLLGWVTNETRNAGVEFMTSNAEVWYKEFGNEDFTDEELESLIEFARFLIWKRK